MMTILWVIIKMMVMKAKVVWEKRKFKGGRYFVERNI